MTAILIDRKGFTSVAEIPFPPRPTGTSPIYEGPHHGTGEDPRGKPARSTRLTFTRSTKLHPTVYEYRELE